MGHGQGAAVGAIADHRIERIGDGKYAGPERDLLTLQSARVTGAIEKFLVSEHDFRGVAKEWNANEHVVADFAVLAHFLLFGVVERPWFAKNTVRDSHLADVMEKSGAR